MTRRTFGIIVGVQAALTIGLGLAIRSGRIPLGVPGEWEWSRIKVETSALPLVLSALGVLVYAGFVGGMGPKRDRGGRLSEWGAIGVLILASIAVQVAAQSGAPEGYGLTKWVTLGMKGSSGYFEVAKTQARDVRRFWAEYPDWIRKQDALHVGTHPPGLFLVSRGALGLMEASPEAARSVDEALPSGLAAGFRAILGPIPRADRASFALVGFLTLLASAGTVAPLYALARASDLSKTTAWRVAALWPLVPSATLFQPTADTAFPILSTGALALALRARRVPAFASGVFLAIGMQFTLAFLAVGLVAGLASATSPGRSARDRLVSILSIGLGFAATTAAAWWISGANPFLIWWWNQRNHARFYAENHRSYLAWVLVNPIELAVSIGLPAFVWIVLGFRKPPRVAWLTLLVLAILTLGGRSLSEIGRLWLPLMPPLLVAAGSAWERLGAGGWSAWATATLMGMQTLCLETLIQVVYPI